MAWKWENWQGSHIPFSADDGGNLYDDKGGKILHAVSIEGDNPHIEVRDEGVARSIELLPQYILKLKSMAGEMRAILDVAEIKRDNAEIIRAFLEKSAKECEELVGEIDWLLDTDY